MHPSIRQYVQTPQIAWDYDRFFRYSPLFVCDTRWLDQHLATPGTLLDVGCGTGRHLTHFAGRGFSVTGVDVSPHMLRLAGLKLLRTGRTATLVQADVCALPFDPARVKFDYIICMFSTLGMIQHHEQRCAVLRNLQNLLRPGGLLAVHVHNYWHNILSIHGLCFIASNACRTLAGRSQRGDKVLESYRGINKMYVHVFRAPELHGLFEQAGLIVDRFEYLNPRRDGIMSQSWMRTVRSNGFLVLGRKPGMATPGPQTILTKSSRTGTVHRTVTVDS